MNLYKFHSIPSRLIGYDVAFEQVPELAWEKYGRNIEELRKREYLWKHSAKCAFAYACNVIKRRFPEGEAVIATSAAYSYNYAMLVIKGQWLEEGEAAIATSAWDASSYACYIIKGRFPKGEVSITTSAQWSYYYVQDIIKGRFPEGEDIITKDPIYLNLYNKFIK